MSPTHNNITYKNKKIKNKFDMIEVGTHVINVL